MRKAQRAYRPITARNPPDRRSHQSEFRLHRTQRRANQKKRRPGGRRWCHVSQVRSGGRRLPRGHAPLCPPYAERSPVVGCAKRSVRTVPITTRNPPGRSITPIRIPVTPNPASREPKETPPRRAASVSHVASQVRWAAVAAWARFALPTLRWLINRGTQPASTSTQSSSRRRRRKTSRSDRLRWRSAAGHKRQQRRWELRRYQSSR